MKLIRSRSNWLLFLILALAQIFPNLVKSQGKNPQQGTTPAPPVSKTKIEVQENGGDFASPWVKSLTITSVGTLAFRYSTNEPGATSAIWQVSDKPFSSSPQITAAQAPHVIAGGALGTVPAPGHVSQFEINFGSFAPQAPPSSPKSYWVFIVTKNSHHYPVGLASVPVKIVYQKSTQPDTDLSGIPLDNQAPPMAIEINLTSFTVHKTNEGEGDDDPYLFVAAFYADGTTVNAADLAHATVRLDSPSKTHNNLGMDAYSDEPKSGKSYSVPIPIGHFEKVIQPIAGGLPLQMARDNSTVGILVITMEEDTTTDSAANAARKAMVDNLQKELSAAIRSFPKKTDIPGIKTRIKAKMKEAAKTETLKDWWTPWGLFDAANPDDVIGVGFATFTYTEILNAGNNSLPITLDCQTTGEHFTFTPGSTQPKKEVIAAAEGHYTITGTIRKK
jgi:hypothetical protein